MYRVSQSGSVRFEGADLRDVVEISGFVIAEKLGVFESKKINEEFGYEKFEVSQGQVMAHSYPNSYVVEKDFWKPLQSIFEYREGVDLNDGEFYVDLDAESGYVEIFAHHSLLKQLNALEKSSEGRTLLINSVFFPTVVQMISRIQESPESVADKKWAKILMAKAESKNINIKDQKVALIAQKFLDQPLLKLTSMHFEKLV
jgi:hypothetical protein